MSTRCTGSRRSRKSSEQLRQTPAELLTEAKGPDVQTAVRTDSEPNMWRICCCSTELTKLTELTELTEPVSRKQTDVKWRQTCRWNIWTSDVTEQVGHICMNWSLIICGTVTSGELWRVTSSDQRDQMKVVDPNMRPSPVTCSELCGSEPWCGLSVLPPFHWTHQALCTVWMCKLTRVSGLCSRTGSARLWSKGKSPLLWEHLDHRPKLNLWFRAQQT